MNPHHWGSHPESGKEHNEVENSFIAFRLTIIELRNNMLRTELMHTLVLPPNAYLAHTHHTKGVI